MGMAIGWDVSRINSTYDESGGGGLSPAIAIFKQFVIILNVLLHTPISSPIFTA